MRSQHLLVLLYFLPCYHVLTDMFKETNVLKVSKELQEVNLLN